jgi:micrococcal nuclease
MFEYRVEVLRVVDGDTLECEIDCGFKIALTEHVRLFGIDTPEVYGPHAVPEGKLASAFTRTWVSDRQGEGKQLWIRSDRYDEREKYGRILATLFCEGEEISLNTALMEAGHAKPMRFLDDRSSN